MKELIAQFSTQLQEALHIGRNTGFTIPKNEFNQIVVSGLGGSGIGASIVQDYVQHSLTIPLTVNKTYHIPAHVNEKTLFIASSYSGNTEETIAALQAARKKKAFIVCISSGGELIALAEKYHYPHIVIPPGNPPRASLAYSVVQLLFVLNKAGLVKKSFEKEIEQAIEHLNEHSKLYEKEAKKLATKMKNKVVVIYTTHGHEGLAIRFRQQLNENSKILSWHNVIPEMTHNEIVGWATTHPELFILFCFAEDEFPKNKKRLEYLRSVLKKYKAGSADIVLSGASYWEKALRFIHLTDWISYYLSTQNGVDAMEVRVIDGLKQTMAGK